MTYLVQKIHPAGIKILQEANLEVKIGNSLYEDDILEGAKDSQAIIIRSQGYLTRRIIEGCPFLKCIGRYGVGVDNIDVETANHLMIPIVYAPKVNSKAVAEHTIMLMLAISRKLPLLNRLMREGKWTELRELEFHSLSEKVLGIVGIGTIGSEVAKLAHAFGMKVLGFDSYLSYEQLKGRDVSPVDKESLLSESDIISLHLPLNASTKHFIGRKEFGLMKPGVILINTSRGAIVNEKTLVEALREGRILAAGLDVFEEEPLRKDSPLLQLENVVVTPHSAGLTEDVLQKLAIMVCKGVVRVLRGELPENIFNKDIFPEL
ncbi:3-phosphoglycerate dehydrogenase [Candidatus Atribacteria bacterium HGW-Atribacteria-1]|nr:MAG: 3-phosphoglycerate dehydrogenase [Candidatus Atribacteria bacterium HGW-Atribacteria-1]